MQKYFAGELRSDQKKSWKADDGIFYLVSDIDPLLVAVEQAMKEKIDDEWINVFKIASLRFELFSARQAVLSEGIQVGELREKLAKLGGGN